MSNLELNEGQEFFIGSQRYVVKDGAPVQEAKRGPLGGELVRFDSLPFGARFSIAFDKLSEDFSRCVTPVFKRICDTKDRKDNVIIECPFVEINVPQPQTGWVMTAGEAARLPDIVGKRVRLSGFVSSTLDSIEPLMIRLNNGDFILLDAGKEIEVLD